MLAQDYRKFNDTGRLVTGGQPCTYFYALDQRKVPDKSIAEALTWALPYNDQIVATGLIPDVNAVATQNLMPPGVPGREEYDPVEGHGPFQTDAGEGQADPGRQRQRGLRDQVPVLDRLRRLGGRQGRAGQGSRSGRLQGHPGCDHAREVVADRDDVNGDINMRSYGWCSDWPSGATWVPPIFQSTDLNEVGFGTNESAFNNPEIDAKIDAVFELPAEDQPKAWNDLEQEIMTTYLPVVPRYYGGVVQMLRLADRGHGHRQHPRACRPSATSG